MDRVKDAKNMLDPGTLSLLSNYEIIAKLIVDSFSVGLHKGPRHAYSLEYSGHRAYTPGDSLRQIDWKLLGRTDHLYVKQFEEETSVQSWLMLDASRSMSYRGKADKLSKWQYASYLAAALSHLMIEQHDAVGLMLFGEKLKQILPPRFSKPHYYEILKALHNHTPAQDKTCFESSARQAAAHMRSRGLIFLVSDFLGPAAEIERAFKILSGGRHELMVLHVLSPDEIRFPFNRLSYFEDMETHERVLMDPAIFKNEYRAGVQAYLEQIRRCSARLKVTYLCVRTDEPMDVSLHAFLKLRERSLR
ncbi:MAG: DUF58 domain-containing protein [Candidatus Omnitrophica bacterium]|nr:DUF58 domain-containing protein [Candidatus Omnitrophota bacterium]